MNQRSALVSVDWLNNRAGDPGIVVLDSSIYAAPARDTRQRGEFYSGLDQYLAEGHIPGARFADLFTEFSDPDSPYAFTLPSREGFQQAASRLGIDTDTHVVIYDGLIGQWAARLWWVFRTLGHERVSVLDGGLKAYLAKGGTLERELRPYARTRYVASAPLRSYARRSDVVDIVEGRTAAQLVCLLRPDDYTGRVSVREKPGHIPGSLNLPFTSLVDPARNTLLPRQEIETLFRAITPLTGERIVTYCGGGIASTLGALALHEIGYENTLEFDGSMMEWLDDPAAPIATGND